MTAGTDHLSKVGERRDIKPVQRIITISVLIMTALIFSGCLRDIFWDFGHYSRDIERYYDTENERMAIEVAEDLNYTYYTDLPRWEYEWANFIDSEVIDHYNASYHRDMENEREADVTFRYYAWADFYPEMDLHLTGVSSTLSVRLNSEYPFHVNDSSEIYYDLSYDEIFLGHTENGSWSVDKYSSVGGGVPSDTEVDLDLYLNNSYFVKMYLSYYDIWGSLAAIYVETFQFVVLDSEFNVMVIGVHPSPWMVS